MVAAYTNAGWVVTCDSDGCAVATEVLCSRHNSTCLTTRLGILGWVTQWRVTGYRVVPKEIVYKCLTCSVEFD